MNRDGIVIVTVATPSTSAMESQPEEILIYKEAKLLSIIPRPNNGEISTASHLHKAPLDAAGNYQYPQAIISQVALAQNGHVYATIQSPFSGGYSGISRWPFIFHSTKWIDALEQTNYTSQYNSSVSAAGNGLQLAILQDCEDSTDYVSQDVQEGNLETDEIFALDASQASFVGRGEIYSTNNGWFVGSFFKYYPAISEIGSPTQAFIWKNGFLKNLGSGVAWSVNVFGIAVGDDRQRTGMPGYPTVWLSGKTIRLSNKKGTAVSVNDSGAIVGTFQGAGAFLAHYQQNTVQLQNIDRILAITDRTLHVEEAFSIANDGSILALVKYNNGLEKLVILKPSR